MTNTRILNASQLRAAIGNRTLRYDDGAEQLFHPDGRTEYRVAGDVQPGRWDVEGDSYVSLWPPSTHRDLYQVEASHDDDGNIVQLAFVHRQSGDRFAGRFIESA